MSILEKRAGSVTTAPLQSLAQGSMFWRPEHVEQSAWLDHLPWIFWLLEAVHPQRCVTLGARRGSPHLALCQGVGRLGLDSECLLVAEDSDTAAAIHALADRRYGALAGRLNVSPRRSVKKLDVGGIDILALDLGPDDEDMEDVLERWLPQVSDRGVVLIPGINRREPGCVANEYFAALQVIYRSITFHQGDGLGVLMVGERPPELLETLISRWNAPTAARTVREVFARLGRACVDQALADAQTAKLRNADARVESLIQDRDERAANVAQLTANLESRDEALRGLESEKLHLAEELADAQGATHSLQTELAQITNQLSEKEAALHTAEHRARGLEDQVAERDRNIQTRFEEIATLTQMLEAATAERDQMRSDLAALEARLDEQTANLTRAEGEQSRLEGVIAEKDANIQTRFQELATMTNIAEEADRQQDYFKRKAETYNQRNEDKKAELKQFRRTYAKLQRELDTRSEEASSFKAKIEKLEQELEKRDKSLADRFDELGSLTAVLEERERELADLKDEGSSQVVRASKFFGARPHGIRLKTTNRKDQERKRRKQQEALAELEASEWFDSLWYLKQYPDIASDDRYSTNPALHYLKFGGFEGRDPSPYFDSAGYLEAYPDVALTEINPLLHFIRDGINEGRSPRP